MEELKDVVLNVFTLATDGPEIGRSASFFSRILPSIGLGAYHTSLELDGYNYTFGAGAGIIKTSTRLQGVPPNATFKEAIPLGSCRPKNRGEIAAVVKALEERFSSTAYHLVHRNCNHFTETLATALILHDELLHDSDNGDGGKAKKKRLCTYPDWVNRLAGTGAMVISHDADIVPCNVWSEASKAVGADTKIRWDFFKSKNSSPSPTSTTKAPPQRKKTLTEAQTKALEKIRKK